MVRQLSEATDFYFAVAEGRISGHTLVEKFGRNPSIDKATEEDIWSFGGNFYYPTADTVISVFSSSTDDNGTS